MLFAVLVTCWQLDVNVNALIKKQFFSLSNFEIIKFDSRALAKIFGIFNVANFFDVKNWTINPNSKLLA